MVDSKLDFSSRFGVHQMCYGLREGEVGYDCRHRIGVVDV